MWRPCSRLTSQLLSEFFSPVHYALSDRKTCAQMHQKPATKTVKLDLNGGPRGKERRGEKDGKEEVVADKIKKEGKEAKGR